MIQLGRDEGPAAVCERDPRESVPAGAARSVRVCFGRRWVSPELLGRLRAGGVLELDADATSPVEIYADGRLAGFGSAAVVSGRLCIRLDRKVAASAAETK